MKPHQYKDIYKSDDVPFQDLSRSVVQKLIWFGIGLFIILFALSFIIKVPREVHLPFELKGGFNETIVQYPENIYIKKHFVQTGEDVVEGDSLIEITSPKIVSFIEEVETWKRQLDIYITKKQVANAQNIALLQTKVTGFKNEIRKVGHEQELANSASNKETNNLQKQLKNAQSQHNRNNTLHDNEIISHSEFEASLRKVQEAEQNLISVKEEYALTIAEIESRMQQLKSSVSQYNKEIEKQQALYEYELADIQNKFKLAEKKLELNYGKYTIAENAIQLISPVNGIITLRTENEYEVPAGNIIIRIQTDSMKYYAYTEAGTKDIGHIKTGTRAVLKFQSFPHYYYGTMSADVASVSPSPAENGNFPVKLIITKKGKLEKRVTKGMTGTASFVIEEKSLFDFVLRVFLKTTTIE